MRNNRQPAGAPLTPEMMEAIKAAAMEFMEANNAPSQQLVPIPQNEPVVLKPAVTFSDFNIYDRSWNPSPIAPVAYNMFTNIANNGTQASMDHMAVDKNHKCFSIDFQNIRTNITTVLECLADNFRVTLGNLYAVLIENVNDVFEGQTPEGDSIPCPMHIEPDFSLLNVEEFSEQINLLMQKDRATRAYIMQPNGSFDDFCIAYMNKLGVSIYNVLRFQLGQIFALYDFSNIPERNIVSYLQRKIDTAFSEFMTHASEEVGYFTANARNIIPFLPELDDFRAVVPEFVNDAIGPKLDQ